MPPTNEIPTSIQLGVSNTHMLWRGLKRHCPVCDGGGLFRRWIVMVERCPQCDLRFVRTEGHMIGYIGLNMMVTFTLTFFVLMAGVLMTKPDIHAVPLGVAATLSAGVFPFAYAPSSRTMWTAVDLIMRPLEAGEVDPRFVRVDPDRDSPARPDDAE